MHSMRDLSSTYLLGYLRGRLKGFRKGNLSFPQVESARLLALRHEVPAADIAAVFPEFGMSWTPSSKDAESVAA